MPDTPDPLAAELAAIRERRKLVAQPTGRADIYINRVYASSADVPRLVAAVEAALALHQPKRVDFAVVCEAHAPLMMKAETLAEGRRQIDACPDCTSRPATECKHCRCPNEKWPCPTYAAISAALTGEGASDGE